MFTSDSLGSNSTHPVSGERFIYSPLSKSQYRYLRKQAKHRGFTKIAVFLTMRQKIRPLHSCSVSQQLPSMHVYATSCKVHNLILHVISSQAMSQTLHYSSKMKMVFERLIVEFHRETNETWGPRRILLKLLKYFK